MRFFGISDLHLSFTSNKPMDRFGPHWELHHEKIAAAWRREVTDDDVVLVPGDHSWGLKLEEAVPDLQWIAALPGLKVMGKGNHDLWWHNGRLEALGLPKTCWLQNNAFVLGRVGVVGSRGWSIPAADSTAEDAKIYKRELERLKLSFQALDRLRRTHEVDTVVCMLHYPPLQAGHMETPITELLVSQGVSLCIYGHMHLSHSARVVRGAHGGVWYEVVSCDFAGFAPRLLIDPAAPSPAVSALQQAAP